MKIYLGEKGLTKSWQNDFKPVIKCKWCGDTARIMFVGKEKKETEYICDIHKNHADGKLWLHDACAVAVYLCENCLEASAEINQA